MRFLLSKPPSTLVEHEGAIEILHELYKNRYLNIPRHVHGSVVVILLIASNDDVIKICQWGVFSGNIQILLVFRLEKNKT